MVENLWLNHYIKQPHDVAGSSLGKTFVTILDFSGQHIKVDFITTIINPLSGKSYRVSFWKFILFFCLEHL